MQALNVKDGWCWWLDCVFTSEERPGMSPLGGDHDVVVRLVPEVVAELRFVLLAGGPRPHRLEGLPVQQDEAALAVLARSVSQGGDHHVPVRQAVGGVGGAHTEGVHLPGLDDLVQAGVAGVRLHVHDVDPVRAQSRHDQPRPGPGGVVETRTAGVPASVVDLVTYVGQVEARDDLGVGRAGRVDVNRGHVVGPVLVRDDAGQVDNLLTGSSLIGLPACRSYRNVLWVGNFAIFQKFFISFLGGKARNVRTVLLKV